jgi:arylsulfatase A-like enzyme
MDERVDIPMVDAIARNTIGDFMDLHLRPNRRPNVIWIMGDQHRAQALGYRGNPDVRTPNIDNLARSGVRFDSAVSGAPWCTPFRGSLLTSLYPNQHGARQTPSLLDPSISTVAAPFADAGYHTAWIGKWHLDGSNHREHYIPPERRGGFDYWMGYENNNNQNECYVFGTEHEEPRRLPGYEVDSLSDLFVAHLREHVHIGRAESENGEYTPFFAVLSVQPPHDPYVAPTSPPYQPAPHTPASVHLRPNVPHISWMREEARLHYAGYYNMVENIDHNIGRITNALKDLDVDRETYLIFFSDHGDMLWSHGQRGKSSPWEESIRIPFIVSRVGGNQNMRTGRTDAVLNHVDIAPTSLGLCGIDVPDWMEGHDYSRHCVRTDAAEYRGDPTPDAEPESAYLQQIPRKMHAHSVNRAWRGVVTRDGWKYACTPRNDWLLFNTVEDPYEQANVAYDKSFQDRKERCHRLLADWIEKTEDDFELPDITLPTA